MQCETCGARSFEVTAEAGAVPGGFYIWSSTLGKVNMHVKMLITCKRCSQEYGGQWSGRVAVPIQKLKKRPFPDWALAQCGEEYGHGWDLRHAGKLSQFRVFPFSVTAGWKAADDWAKDKKGRPPVKGGWKESVVAYLETEAAWEYMRTLVTSRAFSA